MDNQWLRWPRNVYWLWLPFLLWVSGTMSAQDHSIKDAVSKEQARIDFLIKDIAQLEGAVFIRNGIEHSALGAAEHLSNKLARAQDSFFAPSKEKWTAEMFIEKLATRSSLSGKNYLIRFSDGREVQAGEWLKKQLKRYDAGEKLL